MSGLPPVRASTARRSAEWAGVATVVAARDQKHEAILPFEHIVPYFSFETKISCALISKGGSECSNRSSSVDFLIVLHSNYGSIWLSSGEMTTGWTMMDDKHTKDGRQQPLHI